MFATNHINHPGRLVGKDDCHRFWEEELRFLMCDRHEHDFSWDKFPDGYCYGAAEWHAEGDEVVVLLTMHH